MNDQELRYTTSIPAYDLYDGDKLIMRGSSSEISKAVGCHVNYVSTKANKGGLYRGRYKFIRSGYLSKDIVADHPGGNRNHLEVKRRLLTEGRAYRKYIGVYKVGDHITFGRRNGTVIYADRILFVVECKTITGSVRYGFNWVDLMKKGVRAFGY